jgi:hypothetical protein
MSCGSQRGEPRQRPRLLLRPRRPRAGRAGAAGARRGGVHAVRGVRVRGACGGSARRGPAIPRLLLRPEGRPVHRHASPRVSPLLSAPPRLSIFHGCRIS